MPPFVPPLCRVTANATTPPANSTSTTTVMIKPHGVCFWLTIDLPGLRTGGRPGADLVAVAPGRAGLLPGLAPGRVAEGVEGLRWAIGLHSPGGTIPEFPESSSDEARTHAAPARQSRP